MTQNESTRKVRNRWKFYFEILSNLTCRKVLSSVETKV